MLNQLVIVGRLTNKPEKKVSENGKSYLNFTIAVPRSYKNAEGVYETDFIDVTSFGGIADNVSEYCQKGDMLGVKGRVQTSVYENETGDKKKNTEIIADKISFLASSKQKDEVEKSDDDLDM